MNRLLWSAAIVVALSIPCIALAAPSTSASSTSTTDQKTLMKTCNASAKTQGLKGDERKAFMSSCLSGKSATSPAAAATTAPASSATTASSDTSPNDQKNRMKTCNADAKTQGLKGDARKTFMSTCLSGKPTTPTSATLTTPAAAPAVAATADTSTSSQQSLMKTCNAEAKTQGLKGDARKTFMSTCLSGKSNVTSTGASPAAVSGAATGAAAGSTTPPATHITTAPAPGAAAPAGTVLTAGEFSTDTAAKQHCPTDIVVWLNTSSKIYHFAGTHDYGTTKAGAYMCQRDANAAGDRAAANEKPPAH